MKKIKCMESGAIISSRETATIIRCVCGFWATAKPRRNRRSGGEIVPGFTVKMPAHYEGSNYNEKE